MKKILVCLVLSFLLSSCAESRQETKQRISQKLCWTIEGNDGLVVLNGNVHDLNIGKTYFFNCNGQLIKVVKDQK